MVRLSDAWLAERYAQDVVQDAANVVPTLPSYARADTQVGIVHLGLGAFSRAHLAVYTDQVLAAGDNRWGMVGVSLQSPTVAQHLNPQDGLYTLVEHSDKVTGYQVVGALRSVLVAPQDQGLVLEQLHQPSVQVVSLTVTEKGYCHDPATGALQLDHPDILWDLANPKAPRTAVGFLVASLGSRFAAGIAPYTPLCCDNLLSNGELLQRLVLTFAQQLSPQLAAKIEREVHFPSTMVDRIVPATTTEDRQLLAANLGYQDMGVVKAEPFKQWVIQDSFVGARPAWDIAGALFVDDVRPFEQMKLQLLNGSHSAIAYLGCLAGCDTVDEVMADDVLAKFVSDLQQHELGMAVTPPPGIDLGVYQQQLLQRFRNSTLAHRTSQIAMDGSQKIPQRLLAPLRYLLANDKPHTRITAVIAAWIRYVVISVDNGELHDPLAQQLQILARQHAGDAQALAVGFLSLDSVFGTDLLAKPHFVGQLAHWLRQFLSADALTVVAQAND